MNNSEVFFFVKSCSVKNELIFVFFPHSVLLLHLLGNLRFFENSSITSQTYGKLFFIGTVCCRISLEFFPFYLNRSAHVPMQIMTNNFFFCCCTNFFLFFRRTNKQIKTNKTIKTNERDKITQNFLNEINKKFGFFFLLWISHFSILKCLIHIR